MRRGSKPAKSKEAKPPAARKSPKNGDATGYDLEKRLAEALRDKAEARGTLQTRDRELVEALEQQAATSDILRVISASRTDVQPVFDAIVSSAVLLCGAVFGAAVRFDGEQLHLAAHHNLGVLKGSFPMPARTEHVTGRAILERSVVHVSDIRDAPQFSISRALSDSAGYRSMLSVPMLREGEPIGAITVGRAQAEPFSDSRIALLKTFADQAVPVGPSSNVRW